METAPASICRRKKKIFLEAVKGSGKPLVVVLMNGSALSANWVNENANAILDAWYGGEEGGTAVAQTLAGVNNPAGRLPLTFYKGVEQLPPFEDYSMKNRTYRYLKASRLSLRLWAELFQIRLQQFEVVGGDGKRGRSSHCGCRCKECKRAATATKWCSCT